ncbi:MAG TPA: hypothetical protein VHS36_06515, partial [Candidatus Limnocylindrales bacterium]|nr:hypothetical protein [Candidatus Limnocylindrales bacterium]
VDDVEPAGRLDGVRERRERRSTEDLGLVGVDRDAVVAGPDQRPEDPEGGPRRVRGGSDDRDPAGRSKDLVDPRVVEDRDGTAALLEVEQRADAFAIVAIGGRGQLAPSLT